MMRLDCAIYENLFAIVLGIVFAMDWLARYFQRCVSRPSSIRFRAGDSSLLSFRIKIQEQGIEIYTASSVFSVNRNPSRKDLHFLRYFFESNFLL